MQNGTANTSASLTNLVAIFKRRLWLVLATTFVGTLCGGGASVLLPVRYRAQVLLAAESAPTRDYLRLGGYGDAIHIQDQLRIIKEHLYKPALLERIIREFGLYPVTRGAATSRQIDEMRARIQITVEGNDAFYVSFEGTGAAQVRDVANRLAEEFIHEVSAADESRVEEAAGLVGARVEQLRKQMQEQQDRITRYKQATLSELPENLGNNYKLLETIQARLQTVGERISNDAARRVAAANEMRELQRQGATENRAVVEEASAVQKKLEDLRLELKGLQARGYTENHPEVIRLRRQIQEFEASASAQAPVEGPVSARRPAGEPSPFFLRYLQLKSEVEAIDQRLNSSKQEQRDLTAQLETYRSRVQSTPTHAGALADMTRDLESTRTQYQSLLDKQQQATLASKRGKVETNVLWRIADPARLPSAPVTPGRVRILLLGLAAGLCLGLGLAVLAENLDTTFENAEQFQSFFDFPVLCIIPSMNLHNLRRKVRSEEISPRAPARRHTGEQRVSIASVPDRPGKHSLTSQPPPSIATDQYNILAMKIRSQLGDENGRVLTITSAAGGEGKTLTSVNLSLALASTFEGQVLLVDADLRKPRIHHYLDIRPGTCFDDLLVQPRLAIEDCLTTVRTLHVMLGRRSLANNPVQALAAKRMHEILAHARQRYRLIVLDAPPILPMADSHILAGLSDGVLLVVRARQTRRELFQHAVESFHATNILGVVLNDVDVDHTRYAYAYRYYQKNYATKTPA
ncbi:MAG: hypothetical protein DMG07_12925 [Acidobacteria bacterium]|nr:MAG: hypothetical protein DMG07_12925 [Acidobacteriota bacterium]